MNKKTRTLRVDEFIQKNLKEPDRYAFEPEVCDGAPDVEVAEQQFLNLVKMTDANLAACLAFYEKEHAFARNENARRMAKFDMNRATAEIARRKNKMYSAAVEQAFLAEDHKTAVAANDAEANWQRATKRAA